MDEQYDVKNPVCCGEIRNINNYLTCSNCGLIIRWLEPYSKTYIIRNNNVHEPIKYYQRWVKQILGANIKGEEPSMDKFKECKTIYDVRKNLDKKLYGYSYSILSQLLGFEPDVSPDEHVLCMEVFTKIWRKIHRSEQPWSMPYIIYKIFDIYVKDKNVLLFIPLKYNLKNSDHRWEKICKQLQIEYKPTKN